MAPENVSGGVSRAMAAVDLGAESGRVMLARYDGARVMLEEAHRFANRPARIRGHLFWDLPFLWNETLSGLRAARLRSGRLESVGVNTWGVDYALLDDEGLPLGLPFAYRDARTTGVMDEVFDRIPRRRIYERTGIQFLPFNTLYQLAAHRRAQPRQLECATSLLLLPDLFHLWLCGEGVGEETNASTTQLWDPRAREWALDLAEAVPFSQTLLPSLVPPGTLLSALVPEVAAEVGPRVRVAVPATHDTASAVAAIPVLPEDAAQTDGAGWGFISSGTWSLVGQELPAPSITDAALASNFTNEAGVFGTTRFLTNVMGLWLLQECRRAWNAEHSASHAELTYNALVALAADAPPFGPLIDPDDATFLAPAQMPAAIHSWLLARGLQAPESRGALVRCIFESLVLRYREVFELTSTLTGRRVSCIYVVGGGARNSVLNQWLADATGRRVLAGPTEATALGNALLQLVAVGELSTIAEVRAVASRSSQVERFEPDARLRADWDASYDRFRALKRLTYTMPSIRPTGL